MAPDSLLLGYSFSFPPTLPLGGMTAGVFLLLKFPVKPGSRSTFLCHPTCSTLGFLFHLLVFLCDLLWPHVEQSVCPCLLLWSMGCEQMQCQQLPEISSGCGVAFLGFCHHHKKGMVSHATDPRRTKGYLNQTQGQSQTQLSWDQLSELNRADPANPPMYE